MRRKQAEFLVKNHVPAICICCLIVTTLEQEQKAKDILTSAADALVNTVNTVGVMGKGIALQFKEEFPAKLHWRNPSRYKYIKDGLAELAKAIQKHKIKSIAIPPLGCGNGGLNWEIVKKMIQETLEDSNATIHVYEPDADIKKVLQAQRSKEIKLTPSRGLITYAMYYYDSLGENCSLFVANKLAYFLQRQGSKSFAKIKFQAHHYGPYRS